MAVELGRQRNRSCWHVNLPDMRVLSTGAQPGIGELIVPRPSNGFLSGVLHQLTFPGRQPRRGAGVVGSKSPRRNLDSLWTARELWTARLSAPPGHGFEGKAGSVHVRLLGTNPFDFLAMVDRAIY